MTEQDFLTDEIVLAYINEGRTTKTDQHPLTDDLCHQIWQDNKDNWLMWQEPCPSTRRLIRAAADWQLEQVIAWSDDTDCDDPQETAQRLKQAMRPTTTKENNQ